MEGAARLVGEAVLALLEAGISLGPPLVLPLESVFRPPDDPREVLDYTYERALEILQRVRRGVADVATSRKRVELQVSQLEQSATKLVRQVQDALDSGREDVARDAQRREAAVQEQLSELRHQFAVLVGEEERLTGDSQRLQAKVDAFRTRKETIKASYAADEASRRVREAFADIGEDVGDLEVTDAEAGASAAMGSASAAVSELLGETPDRAPTAQDDSGGAGEGGAIPPGLMELRPGAPVAARMNVRQERVSAIERAEPGATEVRTLAAYVRALGGRLEIIADIDGERVVLR